MKKVTAGKDALGNFASEFAHLNDDILFGEVWSREDKLSPRDRSLITVTTLIASGITDSSLVYHLGEAKKNGVTKTEIAEAITHIAFYAGWPKAWAAFRLAKDIFVEDDQCGGLFGLGSPNTAYEKYFIGKSYLNPLTGGDTVAMSNVTFEPMCRNNWHIHHADKGGGQILLCTDGFGWYREWNKPPRKLAPGDVVVIPAGVKHWHGALKTVGFHIFRLGSRVKMPPRNGLKLLPMKSIFRCKKTPTILTFNIKNRPLSCSRFL